MTDNAATDAGQGRVMNIVEDHELLALIERLDAAYGELDWAFCTDKFEPNEVRDMASCGMDAIELAAEYLVELREQRIRS